jgi:hypothetical protein
MDRYIIVQEGERRFVVARSKAGRETEYAGVCVATNEPAAQEIAKALNHYATVEQGRKDVATPMEQWPRMQVKS